MIGSLGVGKLIGIAGINGVHHQRISIGIGSV
jgi:hypothetical protein